MPQVFLIRFRGPLTRRHSAARENKSESSWDIVEVGARQSPTWFRKRQRVGAAASLPAEMPVHHGVSSTPRPRSLKLRVVRP
jgi:hypothetical protein